MAGIYSQGGSAGHRYAGWLSEVEAKNFQFGGKVFNGSPSAIYVGSNLVWAPWLLKDAAIRAIVGAFGQRDGLAVINATDAYLNQLAASDRDKATALAGFINEDPMMVCSLGLQPQGVTMPIRWLKGGNGVLLNTKYYWDNAKNPEVEVDMYVIGNSGNRPLFGCSNGNAWGNGGLAPYYSGSGLVLVYPTSNSGSNYTMGSGFNANARYTAKQTKSKFYFGANSWNLSTYANYVCTNPYYIFGINASDTTGTNIFAATKINIKDDDGVARTLVPFKHKVSEGVYSWQWVDLVSATYDGFAIGTFEEYTPSTQ